MGRSRTVARIVADSSPSSSSSSPSSSAESSFRELDDVFLQTQTRIWLGEVLHTRLDDQLTISDLLADGELLFEVSKSVWTMLLAKCKELRHIKGHKYKPVGSRTSSGRYRPYSNVDSFLKMCKILGLNGIDLFSPSDVVEKRDTRKVCVCVRSLSKRARSKQLNVPDFDIVTYAVAMPTNLVGCLRRSLELSQCSFSSSANYTPYKDSASKFRQKNRVAALRNCDSYSEASDDSESNYMGVPSYTSSTNYSHDTALLSHSNVENSPGVSSVVKKYTLARSVSQDDIQDQEKEEYEQGQHNSSCLAEPVLCSQYVKSDRQLYNLSSTCDNSQRILCAMDSHINNEGRNVHQMAGLDLIDVDSGIGNDASIVGDSLEDISNQLAFPDLLVLGTGNYPFLFDGEDNMFNLLMGTDSHESNSTERTSQNGFGRRFSNDFEDVEVSSSNSMSSVLDRALNLDFDDQSNADNLRTAKINLADLQNYEDDSLDGRSTRGYEFQGINEHGNSVHGLVPDSERSHFETKLEKFGFSTEISSACPNSWQSHSILYQKYVGSFNNEIGGSCPNSGVALLKDTNFSVADNAEEVNGVAMVEVDPVIRNHPNSCLLVALSSNSLDVRCEDSIVSCNSVTVARSERHRRSHSDDSVLKNKDTTIQDINSQGPHTLYKVAIENPAVNSSFVVPTNQSQPKAEKHPCSIMCSSVNVDEKGCQACIGHNEDVLYCAEFTNKDESKHENVDNLLEVSGGRKYKSARLPHGKPHRKPLLRTVVEGTTLFGILCLLLHLRSKSGREKTGEVRKRSSHVQKANGMEFTSRKERNGGRVNGIYPAEKLY